MGDLSEAAKVCWPAPPKTVTHHFTHPSTPHCQPTQGLTHARVTFTSESTGEYCYYELRYTSTAPAPRGTLDLECPVRTQTAARVQIANPLGVDVVLKVAVVGSKQVRRQLCGFGFGLVVRDRLLVGTTGCAGTW